MESCEAKVEIGGRELFAGTGLVAKQAAGSALVRYGDSVVLVAVTRAKNKTTKDFFPLQVEFEERMYAAGKFPGGFLKRESRPSENATISGRLIDRSIRPLFPKDWKYEVQLVCLSLSSDMSNPLDIIGLIGASIALSISEIPFAGPVSAVRIGRIDGQLVINPTFQQLEKSSMEVIIAGTDDAVMMVEGEANEMSEGEFLDAVDLAMAEIRKINDMQRQIISKCAKEKVTYDVHEIDAELEKAVSEFSEAAVWESMDNKGKTDREAIINKLVDEALEKFAKGEDGEVDTEKSKDVKEIIEGVEKKVMRRQIWDKGVRADGRGLNEIRPISCAVGLLPRTHGSGLFTRGQTQVLSIVTLSSIDDSQRIDTISKTGERKYVHQYNFPPFSVGEVKPMRGPSRRDIGHGNLAERALLPVIPSEEDFTYAIRVVSEVLESNGSSSMASVCGSTMALLDAGVKIKKPVAGIAMGLVKNETGEHKILTDIQGLEDHDGDMDFKVAGTRDGITAVQMDIKVKGITRAIMEEAMQRAREARHFILDRIAETINAPKEELSPYAPRLIRMKVEVEKIGAVIGAGGKVIRGIQDETGAQVNIDDTGTILIYSKDLAGTQKAKAMIEALTEDVELGRIYDGKVKRVVSFGAFVEILPNIEGLVHISQLSMDRVGRVEDVVNLGDTVKARVREIDDMGRVNLTMLLDEKDAEAKAASARSSNDRGGDRPPRRDGDRPRYNSDRPSRPGDRPPRRDDRR